MRTFYMNDRLTQFMPGWHKSELVTDDFGNLVPVDPNLYIGAGLDDFYLGNDELLVPYITQPQLGQWYQAH